MTDNQSFKIYLYGLLLLGTLGTTLAHRFVFNPQEEYKNNSKKQLPSHTTSSLLAQEERPFNGLLNLLIMLILIISIFAFPKVWNLSSTAPKEAQPHTPREDS